MAKSLDEFIEEMKKDLESFASEYRKSHAENPEHFPLVLDDNNDGLWLEFLVDHATRDRS